MRINQVSPIYSLTLCVIELSRVTRRCDEDSFAADISDKYILTRYSQLSGVATTAGESRTSLVPILFNVAWRKGSLLIRKSKKTNGCMIRKISSFVNTVINK